jgi:SprT protein
MTHSDSVKVLVANKLEEYYDTAEKLYRVQFPRPVVDYLKKGTTAGVAYLRANRISLNYVLLVENTDHFISQTLPHEIAHLIAWQVYNCGNHGRGWKNVMKLCFGLEPDRCHTYDTSNVKVSRKPVTKYLYKCVCTEYRVGIVVHRKIQSGLAYRCRKCKGDLYSPVTTGTVPRKELSAAEILLNSMQESSVKKSVGSKEISKRSAAQIFIRINPHVSKEDCIEYFVDTLGLTIPTAKIYYNKFKKERQGV